MTVSKLPDLSTCLKFCLSAQRNLVYFYKVEAGKAKDNADIDTERQANIIKNTIERNHSAEGITCRVVKKIVQLEDQGSTNDKKNRVTQICIIPDIESFDQDQQVQLVKNIAQGSCHLFVAMIPWEWNSSRSRDNDLEQVLGSSIKLRDWLKHKFWIACFEPNEKEVVAMGPTTNMEPSCASYTQVNCKPSIRRYILDIMVHLRMHRLLDITKGGGVHTASLRDIVVLAKLISSQKYNKNFVTPEHVKLACVWYFPLHLELVRNSSMDISVLYGSKPDMVDGFLEKIAQLKLAQSSMAQNPLFLETLIVNDVLKRVVPPA